MLYQFKIEVIFLQEMALSLFRGLHIEAVPTNIAMVMTIPEYDKIDFKLTGKNLFRT